jgi:hypothetical protein
MYPCSRGWTVWSVLPAALTSYAPPHVYVHPSQGHLTKCPSRPRANRLVANMTHLPFQQPVSTPIICYRETPSFVTHLPRTEPHVRATLYSLSLKLSTPTATCSYPNLALILRYISYPLNVISTLRCLLHAPNHARKFHGNRILPLKLSNDSSYTVRDAYLARIKNVLNGPCRVCSPSSNDLAVSH